MKTWCVFTYNNKLVFCVLFSTEATDLKTRGYTKDSSHDGNNKMY